MTKGPVKSNVVDLGSLVTEDEDYPRRMVQLFVEATLEAGMAAPLGAAQGMRKLIRVG
jgi:hypothetical protein